MTLARILEQHGFVLAAPATDKTAKRLIEPLLSVLSVGLPGTNENYESPRRAVVKFRLVGGCPNSWCTALGAPGRSRETIVGEIVEKYGTRLVEVLP